jgi:hypothetical protein
MSTDAGSKDNKLKFRDPGFRDTVVKVNNSHTPVAENKNHANPLFNKIKDTLTNSDPSKWEKYGSELSLETKYPKNYEKWEIAYCIDLANGLLTFRSTQNVISEYFGGGYTLKPEGVKAYAIELRPRSWDPRTLIDPFFRSTLEKDKQFKALAEGAVAKELFEMIETTYVNFSSQKSLSITESIQEMTKNILEVAGESDIAIWARDESQEGKVIFKATIQDIAIEVIREKRLDLFNFTLNLSKSDVLSQVKDLTLGRDLFNLLDEKTKTAALQALQNVLDEAGF